MALTWLTLLSLLYLLIPSVSFSLRCLKHHSLKMLLVIFYTLRISYMYTVYFLSFRSQSLFLISPLLPENVLFFTKSSPPIFIFILFIILLLKKALGLGLFYEPWLISLLLYTTCIINFNMHYKQTAYY